MIPRTILWALAGVLSLSAPALAQEKKAEQAKPQEINFEGDEISGDLSRPDGAYIEGRQAVKHSKLIKIREEFKAKVMQSVGEL